MMVNKPEVIEVDIPAKQVLELVKKFSTSAGLDITKYEQHDDKVTHLQTSKKITSYFKTWWEALPQIVDWKIIDIEEKVTRIEMLFRVHRNYRCWFWTVIICLSMLLGISMKLDSGILANLTSTEDPLRRFVLFLTEAGVILLALLVLMGRCVQNNYRSFLRSFQSIRQKHYGDHIESLIRECQLAPMAPELLVFSVVGVSALLAVKVPLNLSWFVTIAVFYGVIGLLTLLIGMVIIGLGHDQFRIRLNFGALGILLIGALLFFYAALFMPSPAYREHLTFLSQTYLTSVLANGDVSETAFMPSTECKACFFLTLFFQITTILIGAVLVSTLMKAAVEVKHWRADFFSARGWGSTQDQVAAVRKISRVFIVTIFVLWIGLAGGFFALVFIVLSVLEFAIFLDNALVPTAIARAFCISTMAMVTWVFSPLLESSVALVVARILIVLYCFPLVWMVYKIVRKRTAMYIRTMKEKRASKHRSVEKYDHISDLLEVIAFDLGVSKPEIVTVASKVPAVMAKYVGFPYFRSFMWITEGCLKLTQEELAGPLAHEMWHIKRHSLRWHILCLLSDISLFGTGFLAMTVNSYQQELDADSYAARFAGKQGVVADFIRALRMMAAVGRLPQGMQGLGLTLSQVSILPETAEHPSFLKKLRGNIGLLFELYFGDEILSYIYPPLEKRIERINAIAAGGAARSGD